MTNGRLLAEWGFLFFAAVTLTLFAFDRGIGERFDLRMLDLATELSLPEQADDIVIVPIDDASLAQVGNWPWDRTRHAQLVDRLADAGAKIIVLDILFLEPGDAVGDAALAAAIKRAGNVTLAHTFTGTPNSEADTQPALPLPIFIEGAAGYGHVSVQPESDGVVRRFALSLASGEQAFPHLASVVAKLLAQPAPADITYPIIPMLNESHFTAEQAANVIAGTSRPETFRGKTVLVGGTAQGLGDRYAVPAYAGSIMSGVTLQANLLSAVVGGNLITDMPRPATLAIMLAAIALLFLAFWQLPPRAVLLLAIGLIALLVSVALLSVVLFKLWLPVGPALLSIAIAYPLWGWRRLASVSRYLGREAVQLQSLSSQLADPEAAGFDVVAQQVTEMKRLSSSVRERLQFMRSVLDASPDPTVMIEGDGKIAMMNARAAELFARASQDDVSFLPELVGAEGARIDPERSEILFPDGRTFLMARADLDEELGSEIIAMRDITDLRASEQQRQQMLEFLSHDMRSPQVAIIGLSRRSDAEIGETERFARIGREAHRTLKLAEDFVQIARLDHTGIQREECDLGALMHEAVDRAHPLAKKNKVLVEIDLPDDPVFCEIDPSSISRVIDNLLGNAIKFTPELKRVYLELMEPAGNFIELSIADEGPGLPPEREADPFARFGAHDTKAGPSAGLGLTYVQKAVQEHGGDIKVVSLPELGTQFIVRIPKQAPNAGGAA